MIEQQSGEQALGAVAAPTAVRAGALVADAAAATHARTRSRLRPDEVVFLWVSRFIIWVFILAVLLPIVLIALASFTAGNSLLVTSVIPSNLSLEHWRNIFDPHQTSILLWLRNSAIVAISTSVLSVLLVATSGYAFSRFRFYGKKYGLMALLLIQMFPAQMSFVALYFFLLKIGLLNTLQGLTLVFLGGGIPFNAWLFKGYIDGLPRDLEEAAYVDGASRWQAFWKVILPLTRPMMAVIFIFQTIGIYNDYILTNFLISDPSKYTVAVGLRGFINNQFGQNWNDFAAGALLAAIPITLMFLVAQRWLISGLSAGAVKG
ncbi:MAG: sugar ABC transporter permease [Thermomicrobia bacterium]|nr:sugar ABC transporter permease [Thermomicrobia bacterium]